MLKKLSTHLLITSLILGYSLALADVDPKQNIENNKGFASINYDRQDSEKTGNQKIINDHSAFNINVIIVKKGALFCKDKAENNNK